VSVGGFGVGGGKTGERRGWTVLRGGQGGGLVCDWGAKGKERVEETKGELSFGKMRVNE